MSFPPFLFKGEEVKGERERKEKQSRVWKHFDWTSIV